MRHFIAAITSPTGWALAIGFAAVLTVPAGLSKLLRTIPDSTANVRVDRMDAAAKKIAARARFERAAGEMCGGENGAWEEVEPGQIQCFTHRGFKTITARLP